MAKVWLDKRFLLVLCFVCGRASLGIDRIDRKGEEEREGERDRGEREGVREAGRVMKYVNKALSYTKSPSGAAN